MFNMYRMVMILPALISATFMGMESISAQNPVVPFAPFYCMWRVECVDNNGTVMNSFSGNGDIADSCPEARDNAWLAAEMCAEGVTCEGCNGYAPRIYLDVCKDVNPVVAVPRVPRGLWVVEYTIKTRGGQTIVMAVEGHSYCDTKQQVDSFICNRLRKAPYCGVCRPLGVRVIQRPGSCCVPCCR